MKRFLVSLLFVYIGFTSVFLVDARQVEAQKKDVELTESNKVKIENSLLKINNMSLSIEVLQSRQAKLQETLINDVSKIKEELKLDSSYTFDYSTLTFKSK